MEDVDYDAAMQAVVADMGEAAKRFKAQRYAPKPPPETPKAEEPAPEAEPNVTASELEAMLNGG